jgi:hypothetical protein
MQTTSTQRIQARISRFGKIQQSIYPPYARVQSVLFTWQEGSIAQEVWKTFPVEEAQLFKVGQPAFLSSRTGRNNQVIWEVEFAGGVAPMPQRFVPTPATEAPSDYPAVPLQQEISIWVQTQAELYTQCFDAAWRTLAAREVSEETVRAAASTLFISASRKFNLER